MHTILTISDVYTPQKSPCPVPKTQNQSFRHLGKKCTREEKRAAMDNAIKFITDKGYPNYTQCARIVEGGEPPIFISYFEDWPVPRVS